MSQDFSGFPISPSDSGSALATILNAMKDAIVSGLSGPTRPSAIQAGGMWVDTSADPTTWVLKLWTGTVDVVVVSIDLTNASASVSAAIDTFVVKHVSEDTVGPILNMLKQRVSGGGQVKSGDVVGEIRYVGRTNSSTNPVVAKIIYTATENETSSAWGGTLSFQSTPAGTNTLLEHMRFINGMVETVLPHKTNADILSGQNVATSASVAQLDATKVLVEFTGSTLCTIQGINSTQATKVIHLHNRSSVNVTLSNQDASGAAADRLSLPDSRNIVMYPQDSVALYYCVADSRWKILYASARFPGFTVDTLLGVAQSWVAPASVSKARVIARAAKNIFSSKSNRYSAGRVLDVGKNLYMWGSNINGGLGVGDVTLRTTPTPVLGNLKFIQVGSPVSPAFNRSAFGLTEAGAAYMWGFNANGELGVGDVTPRSSPVAVLGSHQFSAITAGLAHMLGLTANGTAYAWGNNLFGELGVGDVVPRSSPVAVAGGLTFRELFACGGNANANRSFGLNLAGALYAWGINTNGELGLGDVTPRSSPVAVLGGLTFKTAHVTSQSSYALTPAGALYAWGKNNNGQLGVGDVASRSSPVAVQGGIAFSSIHADPDTNVAATAVLALDANGACYAWGINTNGELGVGDVASRSSPVAVLNGLSFQKVIAAANSSFGLANDGSMYAWGLNDGGQLGVGDVVSRSSPVAVLGGLSFVDFTVVRTSSGPCVHALTWDGKLYSWGWNTSFGELGVGDAIPRSSPVAVVGGLSLRTQDDSDTVVDIPITGGNTYAVRLGAGPCFFGNKPIGNDIYEIEVSYVS